MHKALNRRGRARITPSERGEGLEKPLLSLLEIIRSATPAPVPCLDPALAPPRSIEALTYLPRWPAGAGPEQRPAASLLLLLLFCSCWVDRLHQRPLSHAVPCLGGAVVV